MFNNGKVGISPFYLAESFKHFQNLEINGQHQTMVLLKYGSYAFACVFIFGTRAVLLLFLAPCSPRCPLHSSHNQTSTRLENNKPGLPRHDQYTAISLQIQNNFFSCSCVGHFVVLTDICLLMKFWKSVSWHILLPVLLGLLVPIHFMF